jgi:hypothetical protein
MTNGSNIAAMLRGGAAAPVMEHQAIAPIVHVGRPRPKAISVEIMRDGKSSESISFVHGRGARNTEGLNQEMVGAADPSYEVAGVENLAPAPAAVAPAAPTPRVGRVAAAASGRDGVHAPASSGVGFSGAPESNPFFSGPNSKTIDVP